MEQESLLSRLTQALFNAEPAQPTSEVQTVPGKGQQVVQKQPSVQEKITDNINTELAKAFTKQAVEEAFKPKRTSETKGALEKNAPSNTDDLNFLANPYTPDPISFSGYNDGLRDYATEGTPLRMSDLLTNGYKGPVEDNKPKVITPPDTYVQAYAPMGMGSNSINSLQSARDRIVRMREIKEAQDLTEQFHIGEDGNLYTKNSRGDTVRADFGGIHPSYTKLREAEKLVASLTPEELAANSMAPGTEQGANPNNTPTTNNSSTISSDPTSELAKAAQLTQEERLMRGSNSAIQAIGELAKANTSPRTDDMRDMQQTALTAHNFVRLAQGKDTSNWKPTGDSYSTSGPANQNPLGNSQRMQTLNKMGDYLSKNQVPPIEEMEKISDDITTQKNDIVGKVTSMGSVLGSADNIAYAVDHQNLDEASVAEEITSKWKDATKEDVVGITNAITEARRKYPELKPATVGMVLKRYLETSDQAHWYKAGDGDISATLFYKDSHFLEALDKLANDSTNNYANIEKTFYDARKDLREILSIQKQYQLAIDASNKVVSDNTTFKGKPKFKAVEDYLKANRTQAYDTASALYSKAATLFKRMEQKNNKKEKNTNKKAESN